MKSLFSEQYYKDHWDEFLKCVPGDDYVNLEAELEEKMKVLREAGLTKEQLKAVETIYSKPIADRCHSLVLKELKTLKAAMAGEISWGFTTKRQDVEAEYNFRTRFEFNCLQLREFKKNHNID